MVRVVRAGQCDGVGSHLDYSKKHAEDNCRAGGRHARVRTFPPAVVSFSMHTSSPSYHNVAWKDRRNGRLPLFADGDAGFGELALDLGDGVFAGVDHSCNDGCIGMRLAEYLGQVGGAAGAS